MIVAKDIRKDFGDTKVLKGINLNIEEGDIYGLVGRSGAGKSTLLRLINGLVTYNEGSLEVDGSEVKNLNKRELRLFRKNIGMIFQHFSLLERKNVYHNIALPLKCSKMPKDEIEKRVKELARLVGLEEKLYEKPRNLSGGQKQRVAIARALTLNPKILLCDEATSALDPKTTKSILSLLLEINKKTGITMVIVTHQMSVVRQICNKVSILEHGCIAEKGDVQEIFLKQPKAYTRLVGNSELDLPSEGRNIQLMFNNSVSNQSELFTRMAIDLNMTFSIIDGSFQKYRDDMLGSFIINVDNEQFNNVTEYLNNIKINWIEIEKVLIKVGSEG